MYFIMNLEHANLSNKVKICDGAAPVTLEQPIVHYCFLFLFDFIDYIYIQSAQLKFPAF